MSNNINEQKFYQALEDIFTGANIEGEGGYVNLLKIKRNYYRKILDQFKQDLGKEFEKLSKLGNQIGKPLATDSFKEELFDKLYSFFKRYFSESGSVYYVYTPAWQKIYERVYDDKDVALFWKTHMLYYIKSDILFKNMEVEVEDEKFGIYNFYFDVSNLEHKKNNEKKDIVFFYKETKEEKIEDDNNVYIKKIYIFDVKYKEGNKQGDIPENLSKKLNIPEQIIEKAFKTFKKQSEVDFFINKNAKKFLSEQLHLYLNDILLHEENKFDQGRLEQLRIIQLMAEKIIDFIGQFEDELVRVWNKPKFVLNSNYVISLDKLSTQIIEKFSKHKNLSKQIEEWKELKIVDKDFKFEDIFENGLFDTIKEEYKFLPIDTKYFKDLEIEILNLFDNLDDALDGWLIKSENYQALNTLLPKFKEQVQCIYVDPPFNTGDDFAYVDRFQDSTWLTLMENRIFLANNFLKGNGSFYLHLDDNANYLGKILIKELYEKITEIIFDTNATKDEESDLFGYKSFGNNFVLKHQTIFFSRNRDYKFNKLWKPNRNNTKLNLGLLDLIAQPKKENPKKIEDFDFFIEYRYKNKLIRKKININNEKLFPVGDIWNDIYSFTQSDMRVSESLSFSSAQKPEHLLRRIIQSSTNQGDIVLDFFAGIGTTLAVSKKLNRKFLGVEMGEHFNTTYIDEEKFSYSTFNEKIDKNAIIKIISKNKNEIKCLIKKIGLLGRLKWIIFGDKNLTLPDGRKRRPYLTKDIGWKGGGFFKYYELEQYEDTLKKMKYSFQTPTEIFDVENPYAGYIFFADEKFAYVIKDKYGNLKLDFENLYPNIDWAETISNLAGLKIRKILPGKVILNNDTEEGKIVRFDFENMTEEEKLEFLQLIKPLIWWGEGIN